MKKSLPWIIVALLTIGLIFSIDRNVQFANYQNVYTDTITVRDTLKYYYAVPRDSVVLQYKYITIPVVTKDTTSKTTDMEIVESTPDSVTVSVPISQHKYETESYTAWVSGYRAQLDSCWVYPKTTTITKIQSTKPKKWGLGVQLGVGACKTQLSPYIGIGISYNIFSW